MPTQADFQDAARMLRGTLVALSTSRRHLNRAQATDTLSGGTIAPVVDAALAVTGANVDQLAGQVESMAAICDERGRVCAEHTAAIAGWERRSAQWELDMQRYWASLDDPLHPPAPWPGPAPARPTAPYAWVAPS